MICNEMYPVSCWCGWNSLRNHGPFFRCFPEPARCRIWGGTKRTGGKRREKLALWRIYFFGIISLRIFELWLQSNMGLSQEKEGLTWPNDGSSFFCGLKNVVKALGPGCSVWFSIAIISWKVFCLSHIRYLGDSFTKTSWWFFRWELSTWGPS